MAKKITQTMTVKLEKNTLVERGGGWLLDIIIHEPERAMFAECTAWANPSAAKKHIKKVVVEQTTRKSVKLEPVKLDANGKALSFTGEITYKVDA